MEAGQDLSSHLLLRQNQTSKYVWESLEKLLNSDFILVLGDETRVLPDFIMVLGDETRVLSDFIVVLGDETRV